MDFRFTEEQESFRQEVRDFLEGEIKRGTFKPACDAWIQGFSPEFTRKMAAEALDRPELAEGIRRPGTYQRRPFHPDRRNAALRSPDCPALVCRPPDRPRRDALRHR